jgi:Tol biopolymer transport system component
MRPDGRGRRRVTYGWSPAWSPEGRRLVFTNEHVLWVIGRDGSGRHRLTPQPTDPSCDFSGGESSDYEGAPDWSPSGRWIAFVRYCGSGESGGEVDSIYVIHPDGTGLRRLTVGPVDDSPSWSPDGGRVAFVRLFHVAVVARGGGTVRTLFALRRHEVYDVAWERGTNAKTRR